MKYVYDGGCYRLYSNDMLMGVIKRYIADHDEELVKMGKVTEALQHITTDLNYVGQDELDADESLINFKNGLLCVTDAEIDLIPHTPTVYSTIQIPCKWNGKSEPTPVFDAYIHTLTNCDKSIEQARPFPVADLQEHPRSHHRPGDLRHRAAHLHRVELHRRVRPASHKRARKNGIAAFHDYAEFSRDHKSLSCTAFRSGFFENVRYGL